MENTLTRVQTKLKLMQDAPVKPYNTKELANLYGISRDTMKKWIDRINDLGVHGNYFTINQVKRIFEHLGTPEIN